MKVRIFADGACSENPGPGGWAAVFNSEYKCSTISGNEKLTTNNRMELKAIIEVLKKIISKKNYESDAQYDIYSDSAYVINSITNGWIEIWEKNNWQTTKHDNVKNRDLWEEFSELKRKIKELDINVTFNKIKGHSGNAFNELVDKLAKQESIKAKGE